MNTEMLKKYARLAVKTGVNLQNDEELVINSPAETVEFARLIAEEAYKAGAKKVTLLLSDEKFLKLRYTYESEDVISDLPDWFVASRNDIAHKKCAYIAILCTDPEIYADVPTEKIDAYTRTVKNKCRDFYADSMNNRFRWSLIAYPNLAWAKKMFPSLSDNNAIEKLWEYIFITMRLDKKDAILAWEEHQKRLSLIIDKLNTMNIDTLHYKNALGTDFCIGLTDGYQFTGGREISTSGIPFTANMPTEEVFATPNRLTANGKVVAAMPLAYNGKLIDKFGFTFKDGKVIDFFAETGYDVLKSIIDADEGAKYLGEVALIQKDSPINKLKTLFYNTLFDENASCHFALGKGYPCVVDANTKTDEDFIALGINDSLMHVDFMIGTDDLDIIATTKGGKKIQIFKNGNFVI